jgi:hypothetical protein
MRVQNFSIKWFFFFRLRPASHIVKLLAKRKRLNIPVTMGFRLLLADGPSKGP